MCEIPLQLEYQEKIILNTLDYCFIHLPPQRPLHDRRRKQIE